MKNSVIKRSFAGVATIALAAGTVIAAAPANAVVPLPSIPLGGTNAKPAVPATMALDGSTLYVAQFGNPLDNPAGSKGTKVLVFDANTGAKLREITGFDRPFGLAISGDDLFVSQWGAGNVLVLPKTAATASTPTRTLAGLVQPGGVAVAGDGTVYVSQFGLFDKGGIRVFAPSATTASATLNTGGNNGPAGLKIHGGKLFASIAGPLVPASKVVKFWTLPTTGDAAPTATMQFGGDMGILDVAFDSSGGMYASRSAKGTPPIGIPPVYGNSIEYVDAANIKAGAVTTTAAKKITFPKDSGPGGLAILGSTLFVGTFHTPGDGTYVGLNGNLVARFDLSKNPVVPPKPKAQTLKVTVKKTAAKKNKKKTVVVTRTPKTNAGHTATIKATIKKTLGTVKIHKGKVTFTGKGKKGSFKLTFTAHANGGAHPFHSFKKVYTVHVK